MTTMVMRTLVLPSAMAMKESRTKFRNNSKIIFLDRRMDRITGKRLDLAGGNPHGSLDVFAVRIEVSWKEARNHVADEQDLKSCEYFMASEKLTWSVLLRLPPTQALRASIWHSNLASLFSRVMA